MEERIAQGARSSAPEAQALLDHLRMRGLLQPSCAAKGYSFAYQHLFWPAWDRFARRRGTAHRLLLLDTMQWCSPEVIERYQLHALRALLDYAGRRVPYWRETFERAGFDARDVKTREDLAGLPILTREIVRERYRDLVADEYAGVNLKKGTSGSTGTPLKFEYSPESESWRQATRVRGYSWSGYRPGLPTFYYWAQVNEMPKGVRGWKISLDRALKRESFFDSMHQDERARQVALDRLRRIRPSVVVCYTQSCAQFARWILDRRLRDWDDIPVLCGAEAVLPADRAVLARAFGPHVFETYGTRETMLIAAECDAHDGLHLSEENLLVEIAREGKPTTAEQSGDVLVTDLHNYGMPFIRYQIGDVARMASTKCPCGRGLRKLQRVEGRRADTLRDREGNPIPGIVFHVLLSDARQEIVRQFQAVQRARGDVLLRVVRGQDWSQQGFDSVVARMKKYLHGLPFEVEFQDAILPAASGKIRTIVVESGRAEVEPPTVPSTPLEAPATEVPAIVIPAEEVPAVPSIPVEVPAGAAGHTALEHSA
jgi:phenylacetate-CoA ligase